MEMTRLTAKQIGQALDGFLSSQEVNRLLVNQGYLEGDVGEYRLSPKGQELGGHSDHDNGYGGFAHRQWGWLNFDRSILDELDTSPEAVAEAQREVLDRRHAVQAANKLAQQAAEEKFLASLEDSDTDEGEWDLKKIAIILGVTAATIAAGVGVYKFVQWRKAKKAALDEGIES